MPQTTSSDLTIDEPRPDTTIVEHAVETPSQLALAHEELPKDSPLITRVAFILAGTTLASLVGSINPSNACAKDLNCGAWMEIPPEILGSIFLAANAATFTVGQSLYIFRGLGPFVEYFKKLPNKKRKALAIFLVSVCGIGNSAQNFLIFQAVGAERYQEVLSTVTLMPSAFFTFHSFVKYEWPRIESLFTRKIPLTVLSLRKKLKLPLSSAQQESVEAYGLYNELQNAFSSALEETWVQILYAIREKKIKDPNIQNVRDFLLQFKQPPKSEKLMMLITKRLFQTFGATAALTTVAPFFWNTCRILGAYGAPLPLQVIGGIVTTFFPAYNITNVSVQGFGLMPGMANLLLNKAPLDWIPYTASNNRIKAICAASFAAEIIFAFLSFATLKILEQSNFGNNPILGGFYISFVMLINLLFTRFTFTDLFQRFCNQETKSLLAVQDEKTFLQGMTDLQFRDWLKDPKNASFAKDLLNANQWLENPENAKPLEKLNQLSTPALSEIIVPALANCHHKVSIPEEQDATELSELPQLETLTPSSSSLTISTSTPTGPSSQNDLLQLETVASVSSPNPTPVTPPVAKRWFAFHLPAVNNKTPEPAALAPALGI